MTISCRREVIYVQFHISIYIYICIYIYIYMSIYVYVYIYILYMYSINPGIRSGFMFFRAGLTWTGLIRKSYRKRFGNKKYISK